MTVFQLFAKAQFSDVGLLLASKRDMDAVVAVVPVVLAELAPTFLGELLLPHW